MSKGAQKVPVTLKFAFFGKRWERGIFNYAINCLPLSIFLSFALANTKK